MNLLSSSLVVALLAGVPRVSQWSPDIRQSSIGWFTGDGFTNGMIRYDAAMTVNASNVVDEIAASIDGGYASDHPTTIDWSKVGNDAKPTIYSDNIMSASLTSDQGSNGALYAQSYCFPFAVRNGQGYSITSVANRPRIFGTPGMDPNKCYYGELYAITGRSFRPHFSEPSLWLWDGSMPVDKSKLYRLNVVHPGGFGSGSKVPTLNSLLHFEVPTTVPAGRFYLLAFGNENRYGLSDPKGYPVTVVGTYNPWLSAAVVRNDLIATPSGSDITQSITKLLFAAEKSATEQSPWLIQLPVGTFYVSHSLPIPDHCGIVGAGMNGTRLSPNPSLVGSTNKPGSFYSDLQAFSKDNGNCYATEFKTTPTKIFGGDQKLQSIGPRLCLIHLRGSNTYFRDLSLEVSPDHWRQTVLSIMGGDKGCDRGHCERVRFFYPLAVSQRDYNPGAICRGGLWRHWLWRDCDFHCDSAFDRTNGPNNGFSNNGSFDNCAVIGGEYHAAHGRLSGSMFGAVGGKGSLIFNVSFHDCRRAVTASPGDGLLESVIACCSFDDMLSQFYNGEAIVSENRSGTIFAVSSATMNGFVTNGDTVDRTRWTAFVLSGTGANQFRVISSSSSGIHTIDQSWEIVPDETSKVLFVQAPTNCAFVNNRFSDTAGGINLYGSAFGCLIADNWCRNSLEGVMLNTSWTSGGEISGSYWHTCSNNTFEDGVGYHFVAPRSSKDFAIYSNPQIAFISMDYSRHIGDVTNQLWAAEGAEQGGLENTPSLQKTPLISYIGITNESSYSGRSRYNHHVIDRVPLRRNVWYRTQAGIGAVEILRSEIDDLPAGDTPSYMSISPSSK